MYIVSAFYNFCKIPTEKLSSMRQELLSLMSCQNVLGTIIIAQEGINGTICGFRESIDKVVLFFKANGLYDQIDGLSDGMEYKEHLSQFQVFGKLKVKIKKEIVTFDPSVDPTKGKGDYILAKDWDAFVSDPSTIVIDTRNDYEVQEGTFKGSINPKTINFVDFKAFVEEHLQDKKDAKIGMFCTGGVRCEKSTAYLKQIGFENVYHLKGGILRYLQEMSLIDNIIDANEDQEKNMPPLSGQSTHEELVDVMTRPLSSERRKIVLTQVTDANEDQDKNIQPLSSENAQEELVDVRTRRLSSERRKLVLTQVTDANEDKQRSTSATNSSWIGRCFVFDRRSGVSPQSQVQEHSNAQEVV